jgi:hypothetical protein
MNVKYVSIPSSGAVGFSQLLGTSVTTLYTCGAQAAKPNKFTCVNTDSSPRVVTVYLIRSGETAAAKNLIAVKSVPANDSVEIDEIDNQTLGTGDFIQALADVASKVGVFGSLTEYSVS